MSRRITKPTKWPVRLAKTDQPGHPPSLIRDFVVCMKKHLALTTYWAHSEDRSDWGDAAAQLKAGSATITSCIQHMTLEEEKTRQKIVHYSFMF